MGQSGKIRVRRSFNEGGGESGKITKKVFQIKSQAFGDYEIEIVKIFQKIKLRELVKIKK